MFNVNAPLWIGIIIGGVIGGFAELWGISNPETLIRLARWKDRLFIGCIAIGSAVGAVVLYGLYASGFAMHFGPKPVYVFGIMIGGLLFGSGMAVSGYVPGSEWMALGEGRRDVLYAIPGSLLGAAAWTLLYPTSVGQWLVNAGNFGNLIFTGPIEHIHPWMTFGVSILYAVALLLLAFFLPRYAGGRHSCFRERVKRKVDELDREYHVDTLSYLAEGGMPLDSHSWNGEIVNKDIPEHNFFSPPMLLVGVIIGVIVVLSIFLHQIFGESTTFSWLAGCLFLPHAIYSKQVFATIGWEPLSDIGTFLGAFISSIFFSRRFNAFRSVIPPSWRNRFGNRKSYRAIWTFSGAFIMLFGARMAGGCASGHILSGGIQMAVSAWVFTAAVLLAMLLTARFVYGSSSEKVMAK
ncbi:YeeE/YedE thiosulfate transporter family protein [Sulfoacidibacillus thermotolerans]|uniref:Transporter n=1 Tax=Sulfoacidibacillus thermotolerans TaxID=1765684 RepID=A0A2U3D6V7_SULT2|nr:YeeE/YedE thiosulfate transporter family protein [Sulfoacidibacillus thermotolerans]PWI57019.1 transporter [Sulfoacidibacillus thermotolerans]